MNKKNIMLFAIIYMLYIFAITFSASTGAVEGYEVVVAISTAVETVLIDIVTIPVLIFAIYIILNVCYINRIKWLL